jgi:hypothetical protein
MPKGFRGIHFLCQQGRLAALAGYRIFNELHNEEFSRLFHDFEIRWQTAFWLLPSSSIGRVPPWSRARRKFSREFGHFFV